MWANLNINVSTCLRLGVQASFQHNVKDMDSYTTACLIMGIVLLGPCFGLTCIIMLAHACAWEYKLPSNIMVNISIVIQQHV